MKKFLVCVLAVLAVSAVCADPMPGFYVGNIRYILGGNEDAYINTEDMYALREGGADLKSYDFRGGAAELQPRGRTAKRPVASGRVPSAKDGLMNPESPIEITASGNTVLFAFDKGQYVGIKLRILDENGKVLASLLDEDSRYTLTVSPEAKNYYVECKDMGYSYFLLRIKSGPKYSQPSVSGQNKEYAMYQETLKEYMRQHSITDRKDLTEADLRKIGLIMQEKLYGKEAANQQRIAQEVVDAYMKRKGIKDTSDLTNKDWEILRQEISSAVYRWKSQPAKKSAPAKRRKSR